MELAVNLIKVVSFALRQDGSPQNVVPTTHNRSIPNMVKTTLPRPEIDKRNLANRSIHIPPVSALNPMF